MTSFARRMLWGIAMNATEAKILDKMKAGTFKVDPATRAVSYYHVRRAVRPCKNLTVHENPFGKSDLPAAMRVARSLEATESESREYVDKLRGEIVDAIAGRYLSKAEYGGEADEPLVLVMTESVE